MMRVISGGVDYVGGLERGARFGFQQVLGVEVDIDRAGFDAFEHKMAYLEDARRDMANIHVPITWLHGRYDAWMDPSRVRDALGRGDTAGRKFIEIPTGHMLKTSREALQTFELIVREVSQMAVGREIEPIVPDVEGLEARRLAERARLPKQETNVREFWRDYLLGQERTLGFELMTSISPYQELMARQVQALQLGPGQTVVDLGSGTGALPLFLARRVDAAAGIRIVACDYIREAHKRARQRLADIKSSNHLTVQFVECDLDGAGRQGSIPVAGGSVRAVLASLFLSYVSDPAAMLREIRRVLAPGGILVASTLRRDADMSKLYSEGAVELRSGLARELFGADEEQKVDAALRSYLNEASRLLDFEEAGTFRFWDAAEFVELLQRAGFKDINTAAVFGHPPQAVVASARRA
jgi:ubiquinone/menaquinone biosynthesis C-methylase UbiE